MHAHDTPTQDKQITVAVPEDRVPEFYAFYGHFLAAERYGRRGRRGRRPHGRHGGCGHRHAGHHREQEHEPTPAGTEAPAAPQEPQA